MKRKEERTQREGYKKSLVMKHGIVISPEPLGERGQVVTKFQIKVTKPSSKTGKTIEVKQKEPKTYSVGEVYETIEDIYNYYYHKLLTEETT